MLLLQLDSPLETVKAADVLIVNESEAAERARSLDVGDSVTGFVWIVIKVTRSIGHTLLSPLRALKRKRNT